MSWIDALPLGEDADSGFAGSTPAVSSPGPSLDNCSCFESGSVGVGDRKPRGDESGRDERAGLGAKMIGTELGRTLSAKEPRLVGELLLLDKEGNGGCNITHTCCCPLPWRDIALLFTPAPCFRGEERSASGLSGFSSFSAMKNNTRKLYWCFKEW